jgi:hypothetical protein
MSRLGRSALTRPRRAGGYITGGFLAVDDHRSASWPSSPAENAVQKYLIKLPRVPVVGF